MCNNTPDKFVFVHALQKNLIAFIRLQRASPIQIPYECLPSNITSQIPGGDGGMIVIMHRRQSLPSQRHRQRTVSKLPQTTLPTSNPELLNPPWRAESPLSARRGPQTLITRSIGKRRTPRIQGIGPYGIGVSLLVSYHGTHGLCKSPGLSH